MSNIWRNSVARGFLLTGLTLLGLLVGLGMDYLGQSTAMWVAFVVAFLAGGVPSAIHAFHSLFYERKLDVDLLMVVAALGAASVGHADDGAILLFLFSLSNTLQDWAMARTKRAIQALMALEPAGATVRRGGAEVWVPLAEIQVGDELLVRPGERFPADATVLSGQTSVDESMLTGESVPVDKAPGDPLFSGSLNGHGVIVARVDKPAGESTLARLIRLVEEAQAAKSPTERFAERFEGPYTVAVLLSAPLLFAIFYLGFGVDAGAAWYRAMTFLVVASPCAVVISTPAAMLSAMAAGARAGALFKSGAALEALSRVKIIAMDKTGTLTQGRMKLVAVVPLEGTEAEAHALAAGLERHSEHPIAKAIVESYPGPLPAVSGVQALRGKGIVGRLEALSQEASPRFVAEETRKERSRPTLVDPQPETVWAGTRALAQEYGANLDADAEAHLAALESEGLTTMLLGRGDRVVALLAVADTPRPDAQHAVETLRQRGLRVVMLTGDRPAVAHHIAWALGIEEVYAELLPEEKLETLRHLRQEGKVAMVGDGINDAPALAMADVGVSMGSGTDVALESADLVLMKNDLSRLAGAVELAQATMRTVRFNLSLALSIILIVGTLSLFGLVPLPLGVVAHEGGTVFVCLVGLRLLRHPVRA
ncbi:MAG TPA: cation-translocating P-type ATPase [Meiothermus sp.]|nr:cation-translocating P-type ATPase [Meiothermus sp.]